MIEKKVSSSIGLLAALLLIAPSALFADIDIESKVRAYFSDIPIMIPIARCESEFRQFGDAGAALRGGLGGTMIGVFQISEGVHAAYAKSIGMDISTLEGNLAYSRHIYEQEGTTPWLSSASCWNEVHDTLSINLSMGVVHPQVMRLQKILNAGGFSVAVDGPGSPNNETEKFGVLTREAVQKFQCAKGIACDGDESSTGYGYVGPRTRAALLSLGNLTRQGPALPREETPQIDTTAEIARLQAQIAELTKILTELKTRGS